MIYPQLIFPFGKSPLVGGGGGGGGVTVNTLGADTHSSTGVTFLNASLITVPGGLTNSALVCVVIQGDGSSLITSPSLIWDSGASNQSMSLISSASSSTSQVILFGLRSPNAGTNSTLTWTNAAQVLVQFILFEGVNQTSDAAAFKNFNSATNLAPISVNITSGTGHQVVAGFASNTNFTSVNNNLMLSSAGSGFDNTMNTWAAAANYADGAGSVTMTGNPGNATTSVAAGMDISP